MGDEKEQSSLRRSINWRQGLMIGMGIPLAIIPTIGFTAYYLWAASIVLWALSVAQGFLQNMAFGELATTFPNASGIPGFTQEIFRSKKGNKKYDRGKFIGGFCGWAYWLVWAPGLAIFIILIVSYLQGLSPSLAAVDTTTLNLIIGLMILVGLAVVSSRGLKYSARLGLIVTALTFIPLLIIVAAPFFTGNFHLANITGSWVPSNWTWSGNNIMLILGLMVMAQWSACCWEVVAVYGPEYKKPSIDLPKALFACGIVCLVMYTLIQVSVIGTLGVNGVINEQLSPLLPVAQMTFGTIGADITILLLVGAMILMIQIGYSAGARALHAMSLEGNLPKWFSRTNSKGEPMRAVIVTGIFNMFLLLMGNPVAILAASAIGYVFVFAIALFAYVKART